MLPDATGHQEMVQLVTPGGETIDASGEISQKRPAYWSRKIYAIAVALALISNVAITVIVLRNARERLTEWANDVIDLNKHQWEARGINKAHEVSKPFLDGQKESDKFEEEIQKIYPAGHAPNRDVAE